MGAKPLDITGHSFGWLIALEPTEKRSGGHIVWRCRCTICNNTTEVSGGNLRSGNTRACGCMHNETKTSCIHGHLYDDDNTYIDSRGHRHCRACRRAQYREWQKSNPAKVNAKNKLRKAKEKDLAPQLSSSEQELIRRTYHLSDNLGPGWHVDHIIPLALEGLHHPNNLQIISASENCQKQANDGYHPSIAVVVNCDKITLKCQGGMVEII